VEEIDKKSEKKAVDTYALQKPKPYAKKKEREKGGDRGKFY